jgi:hypothetical protein
MPVSDRSTDKCDECEETKAVKAYSVPTRAFYEGESRTLRTVFWCDDCAELNKELIISDEELKILAGKG